MNPSQLPPGRPGQGRPQRLPSSSFYSPSALPQSGASAGPAGKQQQPHFQGQPGYPPRSSSFLPPPPASGLPRANERRIRNEMPDQSDTSVRSTEEEDDFDAPDCHLDGFHPPGKSHRPEPQPLHSGSLPFLSPASSLGNLHINSGFFDPWRDEFNLFRVPSPVDFYSQPPLPPPPPLSAILRALFPEWTAAVPPMRPGPWQMSQPFGGPPPPSPGFNFSEPLEFPYFEESYAGAANDPYRPVQGQRGKNKRHRK